MKKGKRPPKRRKSLAARPNQRTQSEAAPTLKPNTYPLDYASPLLRLYAVVTDIAILYAIILVTKQLFGDSVWHPEATAQDIGILLGYFVLPTVLWGRTIGKIVIGIVVVDDEGYPCGLRGLPREVAWKLVALAPLGLGIFWMLFDKKRRGLHDKLAGTFVVYNPSSGISSWFRKSSTGSGK